MSVVNGETTLNNKQRNKGQSGFEQWSVIGQSVLLHSSQHNFADFSEYATLAYDERPLNIRNSDIKAIKDLILICLLSAMQKQKSNRSPQAPHP
jgi:hypothetical protein